MAKVTIAVPFHWMRNWEFFLSRCLKSIEKQTFTDYEVVLVKHSTMPLTSNRAIESATGELVKILYMDDYFAHGMALEEIVNNFKEEDKWLVTGCLHDSGNSVLTDAHYPKYTNDIYTGNNGIGSPSVLTFRKEGCLFFDDGLSWLLDCDLYKRYFDLYGPPKILNDLNVVIGLHQGQASNLMQQGEKEKEHQYVFNKYA